MKESTKQWPGGHRFAFTIIDDTDWATVQLVKPVYDLLFALGFRTTKTVWMFRSSNGINAGETCQDPDYLAWVLELQRRGFEIALHNAAAGSSPREVTVRALDIFRDIFGNETSIHCNHTGCMENLYWGRMRLSDWRRSLYGLLCRGQTVRASFGHVTGHPLFWGDHCRDRVRYVRNFVFSDLNSLRMCEWMPYHDPEKPFVNFWFAAADAGNLATFLRNFTLEKIDKLVREGGACIMYTHFGAGFAPSGRLNGEFIKRMEYVAAKGGWFAPVTELLEHLRGGQTTAERQIPTHALRSLERRWLADKLGVDAKKRWRRLFA